MPVPQVRGVARPKR